MWVWDDVAVTAGDDNDENARVGLSDVRMDHEV
jgi:hypothetical protein